MKKILLLVTIMGITGTNQAVTQTQDDKYTYTIHQEKNDFTIYDKGAKNKIATVTTVVEPDDIAVQGGYVYITSTKAGIRQKFDATNPAKTTLVRNYDTTNPDGEWSEHPITTPI